MLYLLGVFSGQATVFNLFRYITFRTGGAIVTAMLVVFVLGPWLIDALRARQGKGQPIREDGPQTHLLTKKGTPTMGGLMILIGLFVATILWANPYNPYVWIVLAVTLSYGLIGFYDDYLKVTKRTTSGFSGKLRLGLELLIAGLATYAMSAAGGKFGTALTVPFFKEVVLDLGPVLFLCLGVFVIAGAGNAVNLTDGLDGLAIVPVMIAASAFGVIAYLVGNRVFLRLPADPSRRRHGRTRGHMRGAAWRGARLPLVQRAARHDLHGRYRLAGAGRRVGHHRGRGQT